MKAYWCLTTALFVFVFLTLHCEPAFAAVEKLLDTTLFASTPEHYRWSEGSILNVDGKDHLMMAVSAFGSGGHDHSSAQILEVHSYDGGLTWTPLDEAKVLQDNVGKQTVMNPSLLRLNNGELLCFVSVKNSLTDCGVWVKRSRDDGKTWGELNRLPYEGYGGLGCDRAIQLSTGRIAVPCWISMDSLGSTHAYCFYSDDGGATWSKPESSGIPSPGSMATIKRLPNGDILLIWNWARLEDIDGPWPRVFISTAISKDDGKNFASVRHLDGAADFPGKITMANVTFVGDNAVITYSKSMTKKNAYNWRLQVIPIRWFYEGDMEQAYGESYLPSLEAFHAKPGTQAQAAPADIRRPAPEDRVVALSKSSDRVEDKLFIFYQGRQTLHWAEPPFGHIGSVGLAFLRPDGFVSLDAQNAEGSVTTSPLMLRGDTLHVNAVARPGTVAVKVLDAEGTPVEGFTRGDCAALTGDSLDHLVAWKGNHTLVDLRDRAVRLRFHVQGAKLYSFWMA